MRKKEKEQYLSQQQAAKKIGVSRQTIFTAISRGLLKYETIGGHKFITIGELTRWNAQRRPKGWAAYHAIKAESLKN